MAWKVDIQQEDFDIVALQRELQGSDHLCGAVASFVGMVRSEAEEPLMTLELEHYPGMTERSIKDIVAAARERWMLIDARVVHRVGCLNAGENIVYVGVASRHRGDAFAACEFIMDYLKTRAPFWKKENRQSGSHWVDARESDRIAATRWATIEKNRPNKV